MSGTNPIRRDARGVSTTLGYVLNVAVATLLLTGLLIAGGAVVDDQRERVTRTELRVVGQQVASDLAAADRLVADLDGGDTMRFRRELPAAVAGSPYTIEVVGGADPHLVLSTTDPDVVVRVELTLEADLSSATIQGGDYAIVWLDSTDELEVRRD